MELDDLLKKMNDALGGRLESDIPARDDPEDPYWHARRAYQSALHRNDGVHVPKVKVEEPIRAEEPVIEEPVTETQPETETKTLEEQLASIGVV